MLPANEFYFQSFTHTSVIDWQKEPLCTKLKQKSRSNALKLRFKMSLTCSTLEKEIQKCSPQELAVQIAVLAVRQLLPAVEDPGFQSVPSVPMIRFAAASS